MSEGTNTPNGDSKKNLYETNEATIKGKLGTCCIDMNIVEKNKKDIENVLESDANFFESINEIKRNGYMEIAVGTIGEPVQYIRDDIESLKNALKIIRDREVANGKENFFKTKNAMKYSDYKKASMRKGKEQEDEKSEENKDRDDE